MGLVLLLMMSMSRVDIVDVSRLVIAVKDGEGSLEFG